MLVELLPRLEAVHGLALAAAGAIGACVRADVQAMACAQRSPRRGVQLQPVPTRGQSLVVVLLQQVAHHADVVGVDLGQFANARRLFAVVRERVEGAG